MTETDHPYMFALTALLSPVMVALLLFAVGPGLAESTANKLAIAETAAPPFVEMGYLTGFLSGAITLFISSWLDSKESVSDAVRYAEARIATVQYPKHGDSK